jgi:hypothetical protein
MKTPPCFLLKNLFKIKILVRAAQYELSKVGRGGLFFDFYLFLLRKKNKDKI